MDFQNCAYAKLDSMDMDPEIYKRGDDLAVLIEPQSPLVEKVPYTYAKNGTVKKIKKKKRVLSTLDILISIFIVTPCVVGCWRGIWQIMDIYAVYFPAWESFTIGTATHIVLALGQDVFHHVVVEKETKHPFLRIFSLFLMKFYIITFNVITNLIWRGAWILFDRYCGLQSTENAVVISEGSSTAVWFTIVCILILFCMKGLKNTMSPPFSIALDSKDEVFLFRTRYIYQITYCTIAIFMKQRQIPENKPENKPETAEKLVSSQSLQIENYEKQPPRPFGIKVLGPPPQEFTPTTTTPTPTTIRAPSMNYPQLTNYRNNYHPKNIQEILGYMNQPFSHEMEEIVESSQKDKLRQATNQEGFKQSLNSSGFANHDPFYPYKPTDPSEINLLATASFRFAPPAWKNFRKLYQQQQLSKHQNIQQVETSNVQETIRNFAKPFVVTLNIIPMEEQYPSPGFSRYGQKRIQDRVPYKPYVDSRARFLGNKMTIRLNVFPESIFPFFEEGERALESNVNKIRFV